jgi:hypothetical protein
VSRTRAKKKQRRRARVAAADGAAAPARPSAKRAVKPAAEPAERRPSRVEVRDGVARPRPIWAPFPLTEIGMAAGIAIFVAGMLSDGSRGTSLLTIAVLMLVVVVGELCLREHFAGFRSHTLLLSVLPVAILNGLVVLVFGDAVRGPPVLVVDVALVGALAWLLTQRFRRAHERAVGPAEV